MNNLYPNNVNTHLKSIIIGFLLCTIFNVSAQKLIKLDEELVTNSTVLKVKLKGGSGMFKYLFGDFAVISTKNKDNNIRNGEIRDTISGSYSSRYNLSSYKEEIWGVTEQKQNFIFLGYQKDTVLVNMATAYDYNSKMDSENRDKSRVESTIIKNSSEKFVAFLTQTKDVPTWIVEIDTQLGKEVKARGGIISNGTLSDGSTLIEINPVENWSNGKISKLFPILGFEFIYNGECIAAVQVSKSMGSKKYVWLKNNLPKELELILATAATTVMAMVDNQAMR